MSFKPGDVVVCVDARGVASHDLRAGAACVVHDIDGEYVVLLDADGEERRWKRARFKALKGCGIPGHIKPHPMFPGAWVSA